MLQGLFCGNAIGRIIDEDLPQKIEEVAAEFVVLGNDFLSYVSQSIKDGPLHRLTSSLFIALTNLLEALVVSGCG